MPDKILSAQFVPARCGLSWIEAPEQEDDGCWYTIWLLVQQSTDRVMATIDGPTKKQLTYRVLLDGGQSRSFISIDGAQRYALGEALRTLHDENNTSAERRKVRHLVRKGMA